MPQSATKIKKEATMKLTQILDYTNCLLEPNRYKDYAPNGLQVEGDGRDIQRICCAVSASLAAVNEAIQKGADALFVHHGWFWKHDDPRIIGIRRNRIRTLLQSGTALVAYHLPLDDHPEFGNNALFGKVLGLRPEGRFGEDDLGWIGTFHETTTVENLSKKVSTVLGRTPLIVGSESRPIRRVAWCTGAAQDYLEAASEAGADVFLSGEISERTTHIARETGVPYFSCGHHATERFGIRALGEKVHDQFGIDVEFIDIDNPV